MKEKPKKGSKHQRHERYGIRRKIAKTKNRVCYLMITEVMNLREDIKICEEIRAAYGYILKIA